MENINLDTNFWKPIKGFENKYFICSKGKVLSFINNKFKILTPSLDNHGYRVVFLGNNRGKNKNYVHRLVAKHFIDNPFNKREVNHINSNRSDNRIENLEWVTRKENAKHGVDFGFNTISDRTSKMVIDEQTGQLYKNAKEVAKLINVPLHNIYAWLNPKRTSNTNPTTFRYI